MLCLAASDYIAGSAQTASTVVLTISGMELSGTTETYKVLFQGYLPVAAANQYQAPLSTVAFIRKMVMVNTSSTLTQNVRLFRGGGALANSITPQITLPPNGMAVYNDGDGWKVLDSSGSILWRMGNGLTSAFLTASSANATSTTEAIVGPTLSIPANFLKTGSVVRFELGFSAAQGATAQTTPGCQFRLRYGGLTGTIVGSVGTITPATLLAASNTGYLRGFWNILTVGATGTSRSNMTVNDPRGTRIAAGDIPSRSNNTGSTTIDTTADKDLVITHQCQVADASNITFGFTGHLTILTNN
jgi:hypothetical protein